MATELYGSLIENFPEARELPQAIMGGETSIEELVSAVTEVITRSRQKAATEGIDSATDEIRRYVVALADRPLPQRPQHAELPFTGNVIVVADKLGVAAALAERLRECGREVTIAAPEDEFIGNGDFALIDLSRLEHASDSAQPGAPPPHGAQN